MRIAVAITHEYPLQLPKGKIYAPIPIHMEVAQGLAAKGHEVTVFCSEDTIVTPPMKKYSLGIDSTWKLKAENPVGQYGPPFPTVMDQLMLSKMYELANQGQFDLVWHSNPILSATYSRFSKVPSLFTLHDPLTEPYAALRGYLEHKNHWYVSVSDAQRTLLPDLRYIDTVYNGLHMETAPFEATPDDYYVFFGRIMPEKGVMESIQVAKKAGVKLKIIGCLSKDKPHRVAYWEECMKHVDGEQISYLGCLTKEELLPVVAKARGLINMIDIHESFGMVVVESLACGTPVLSRRRGALPEILLDGETGYFAETVEEAAELLPKLDSIDRTFCRSYVQERFSMRQCIENYNRVMRQAVALSFE